MAKHKTSRNRPGVLILLWLLGLGMLFAMLLYGTDIRLLNPKGLIADDQFKLIVFTTVVLLLIAVPTLFFLYFFAWKYRETNKKVTYDPDKQHGRFFIFSLWAIPSLFAIVLAVVMWGAAHRLDPHKSIAASDKTLTVQVVALRWKWLFIYPEQGIATVNFVQAPVNTPVEFDLTADDAPMSSFWIPNLGGQLYTMTSHVNRLNLMAETVGDYPGSTAEINGNGFAGMKFTARASSTDSFNDWVQSVKESPDALDSSTYQKLLIPSEYNSSVFYSAFESNLYDNVIKKYEGPEGHSH